MAGTKKHPECLQKKTKCKLLPILPSRFALTSEKEPPLASSGIAGKDELVPVANYQYTLRTVQTGYIYITWEGLSDDDILVYEAKNNRYTEVTEHGYGSFLHCLRIPDDPDITEVYMAYVRIPEKSAQSGEGDSSDSVQQSGSSGSDKKEELWYLVAQNLLKNKKELMQVVKLRAAPYSAPREQIFTLVEEFRNPAATRRLHYLRTWPKSRGFLKSPTDTAIPEECWEASVDPGYYVDKSVHDMYIPQDTVLVALHDAIGQVYDFASIYHKSYAGMRNYERFHSHMHTSGFFSQGALDSLAAQLKAKTIARQQKLIREHGLDPRLLSPGNRNAATPQPIPDMFTFAPVQTPFGSLFPVTGGLIRGEVNRQRDKAEEEVRKLNSYDPKTDPEYLELLLKQDIGEFEGYRAQCVAAMKAFSEESQMALVDWFTLLGVDKEKKFAFHWTLREVFKSTDQEAAAPTADADPLTHARDSIFVEAHNSLSFYSTVGDAGQGSTCAHYELVYTKLAKSAGYMDLFDHVVSKGGAPHKRYSALTQELGGFMGYCNRLGAGESAKKATVDTMLEAFAKRFGLEKPARTLPLGPQPLIDALLLGNMVQHLDEATLSASYGFFDVAKPGSDLLWFFEVFNDQYLAKFDPDSQELRAAIKAAQAELAALAGKRGTPAKVARRRLESAAAKLRNRLGAHQISLFRSHGSTVTGADGRPWKGGAGQGAGEGGRLERQSTPKSSPLQGTHKTISFHVGNFVSLLAICNTVAYGNDAFTKARKDELGGAFLSAIHMLPHALTAAEGVFLAFGKKTAAARIHPFALVAGVVSDSISTVDLALNRDWDAALGCGMMAASGVALTYVAFTGGTVGLASMSTPVSAVIFLMFTTGFVIYMVCKDSDIEKYLKNGLWSKQGAASRNEIRNRRVECLTPCTGNREWQKQRDEVTTYIQLFFPVGITLFSDEKHVYVGLSMPLSGNRDKILVIEFGSEATFIPLTTEDAVAEPVEEAVDGLHLFEVCFDVAKLKTKNPPQKFMMNGEFYPYPSYLTVSLTYQYSKDVTYETTTASIAADIPTPAKEENAVARARLAAMLKNAQSPTL